MEKLKNYIKKIYENIYVKIFLFSFLSLIFSYILIFFMAYIEYKLSYEIILFMFLFIFYIVIYLLLNKKYIKSELRLKNLVIPFLFSLIILLPFINELYDVLTKPQYDYPMIKKPIIYLYPEQKQEIKVQLEVDGKIIADYPKYDEKIKGWEVTAYPDGKVIENGKEYSYIFWEALFKNNDWDLSKGFIVEGFDAREFLEEKLSYMGLTPKEYNEFIVYWYPEMMNNKYNLVYFAGKDYESRAPLHIEPRPDSMLRVFMVMKPLTEKIDIEEQKLEKFERKGFSVVEWGGTILE